MLSSKQRFNMTFDFLLMYNKDMKQTQRENTPKNLILQALKRGLIPLVIIIILSIIMVLQSVDVNNIKGTLITGIIVSIIAAASVIYEIKSWSLKKQSIIHFLVMLFTVYPLLLVSGWYKLSSPLDYIGVFGGFLCFGIVFWLLGYIIFGKIIKD